MRCLAGREAEAWAGISAVPITAWVGAGRSGGRLRHGAAVRTEWSGYTFGAGRLRACARQAQRWWAGPATVAPTRRDGMEVVFLSLAVLPGVRPVPEVREVGVPMQQGGGVDGFLLAYDGFDPGSEGPREALTSTGNGYLCARGTAEWEEADGVHYPGTYVHGGYNRETTILSGLPVLNEDLVNLPNWLVLQLRVEGGDAIRLADMELLQYRHELDIRYAAVIRRLRFRDRDGRETTLHSRRFVSMADPHHGGIEWTLVAENWSGRVEVVTAIDGRVSNAGVARYRQLEGRHLNPVSPRTLGPEVIALKAETRQSNLYISQATRTRVFRDGQQLPVNRTLYQMEDYIRQVLAFDVPQGAATRVEKMVAFYTSRDPAVSDTLVRAATSAARHDEFAASLRRHSAAWDGLWRVCDMR